MGVRNIKDLDLRGKRALIRVDFNVPIKGGVIQEDTRIRASLPTIRYALEQGATVILMSHLGRPKGKPNPEYSLRPIAAHLARLLGRPVEFAEDCIGPQAKATVEKAVAGAASSCSRICASTPRRRRTTAGSRKALRSLATSLSTTRSDPPIARTHRPRGSCGT